MSVEQMIQDLASGGELEHYGVKGMKWGVRKRAYVKASGRTTRAGSGNAKAVSQPKQTSKAGGSSSTAAPKKTSEMSNEELRSVLDRMRMETELSKFTAPRQSQTKKYVDYAKDKFIKAIIDGSSSFAKGYVTTSLYKAVKMPEPKKDEDKDKGKGKGKG